MLDLEQIRVALFDFDDTLCIHTRRPQSKELPDDVYSARVFSGENPWPDGVAPRIMQEFVSLCAAQSVRLGLISGTSTHMRSEAKIAWVEKNYGVVMGNYCVGKQEFKQQMLHDICRHFHVQPSEVLFVDDAYANLEAASADGYIACSPMEVVYFMEQRQEGGVT